MPFLSNVEKVLVISSTRSLPTFNLELLRTLVAFGVGNDMPKKPYIFYWTLKNNSLNRVQWASPKKIQKVQGMKFPGAFKKLYVHVEYAGVIKKKCGISKGCNTTFWNFQGWSFLFSINSKGKVTNLETPGFFWKICS